MFEADKAELTWTMDRHVRERAALELLHGLLSIP